MIVMQKWTFMQEFTFAINVECLHSLSLTNYYCILAHVQNMQKRANVALK